MTKAEYKAKRAKILKARERAYRAWDKAEDVLEWARDKADKAQAKYGRAWDKIRADLDKLDAEYKKGAGE